MRIKFCLFSCLLLISCWGFCQTTGIKKSTDVVVIKGKSYYLHVVEEGQTLFSICKAYGVSVEEVKELNKKAENSISIFDVLKIPYREPYVERDSKYYYHQVEKGETLYSISRHYGIKVRRILKENIQYEETALGIGDIVRLPLSEINGGTLPAVGMEKKSETEVAPSEIEEKKEAETEKSAVIASVPERTRVSGDTLFLTAERPVFAEPDTEVMPEFVKDPALPDNKYVKVALLLPLYARDNQLANPEPDLSDSGTIVTYDQHLLHKSEQFVFFYEGILLAVDSLKREGYKIDLHVYDTEKNSNRMYQITGEINDLNPDLIIGPVYASELKVIAENMTNKNIPLVYPLSSRSEDFCKYANFLQVNPSFASLAEKMASWMYEQSDSANIIHVSLSKEEFIDEQILTDMTEKKLFTEKLHQIPDIHFYKWDFQEEAAETFKLLLKEDRENIIIIPTSREADVSKILPVLSAFADAYRITVVGFPDWQNFTSVDHETFYKLNVKLFVYSYVNYSGEQNRDFSVVYRKYFRTEPSSLTNKAYDMALYFIPLAAKFGDRMLEAIRFCGKDGIFSRFYFERICAGGGQENKGLYIVNYGSDYSLKIVPLELK